MKKIFIYFLFFLMITSYQLNSKTPKKISDEIVSKFNIKELSDGQTVISDNNFSITFPNKVLSPYGDKIKDKNEEIIYIHFLGFELDYKSRLMLYIFEYPEYVDFSNISSEEINKNCTEITETFDADILEKEIINYKNYNGIEFLLKPKDSINKIYKYRLIYAKNRLYQLIIFNDNEINKEVEEKFYNSFELKN